MPVAERLAWIDRTDPGIALTTQAQLLSLPRSRLYYRPVPPSPTEVALKHRSDEIYTK